MTLMVRLDFIILYLKLKKKQMNGKILEELLKFAKTLSEKEKLTLSQALEPHLDIIDELIMMNDYLQDNHSADLYK